MGPDLGGGLEIDVCSFGARGDGVTDDAPAFRRALAAAKRTGSSVLVPAGRYALGEDHDNPFSCVDLPANASLQGPGTLLFVAGVRDSVRLLRIAAPQVTVRGIGFDLSGAPGGMSFAISVQAGARRVLLAELAVRGNPSRGGVQVIGGSDITIRRCQILDMAQNGVTLYGDGPGDGPASILIDECHITASVQPVDCEPVNGALCRGVTVSRSHLVALTDNYALTLSGARSARVLDSTLRGSLYLSGAFNTRIERCLVDARGSVDHDAVVAFGRSGLCTLERNVIESAEDRAGLSMERRASGAPDNFRIQSNLIRARGDAGVGIRAIDARHVRVINNEIIGNGATGIDFRVTASSHAEVGTNIVRGNRTTGFSQAVRLPSK